MKTLIVLLAILLFPIQALCADVPMRWDAVPGTISYQIQMSTDQGLTWPVTRPVASGTTYTWLGAPDTGMVLFRAVSLNAQGTTIRTDAGAWFNRNWQLPAAVGGLGTN